MTAACPAWTTALWLLFLSGFRDDNICYGTTAAAFAPRPKAIRITKPASMREKEMPGAFSSGDHRRVSYAGTVTIQHCSRPTKKILPKASPVTRFQMPCPVKVASTNPWTELVPPVKLSDLKEHAMSGQGVDVTAEWEFGADVTDVARSMLQTSTILSREPNTMVMVTHLASCMKEFESFCQNHLRVISSHKEQYQEQPEKRIRLFRARIVATRGSSGTKCPRWHVDHVPVRWIQSLVGPGCMYIDCTDDGKVVDEWNRMKNHLEREEFDELVPIPSPSHLQVNKAPEQEATLLVGNRFNEFAQEQESNRFVPPVLHKSPVIPFWQGRVLLTMDVIVPNPVDDEFC